MVGFSDLPQGFLRMLNVRDDVINVTNLPPSGFDIFSNWKDILGGQAGGWQHKSTTLNQTENAQFTIKVPSDRSWWLLKAILYGDNIPAGAQGSIETFQIDAQNMNLLIAAPAGFTGLSTIKVTGTGIYSVFYGTIGGTAGSDGLEVHRALPIRQNIVYVPQIITGAAQPASIFVGFWIWETQKITPKASVTTTKQAQTVDDSWQ